MKVLVVDNDVELLESISDFLSEEFDVLTAGSVEEALHVFRRSKVDMVLSDYNMPEKNGIELCRLVKASHHERYIPFVLFTGSASKECELEAFEAGADDFLEKPFRSQVLIAKCRLMTHLKKINEKLSELNSSLALKVEQQVKELEKINQLKRYFSPSKIQQIIASDKLNSFGDDLVRDDVSVLFCDIRNFSEISESVNPQVVKDLLDYFIESASEAVFANMGYIDKFLGDGILCIFQKTDAGDKHFINATRAATAIQARVQQFQSILPIELGHNFKIGFGIHQGKVILGNIGKGQLRDFTAVGSSVNLSARLQSYSKENNIVACYDLASRYEPELALKNLRTKKVKGFREPIEICDIQLAVR